MNRLTHEQRPVIGHSVDTCSMGYGGYRVTISFAGGGQLSVLFRTEGWGQQQIDKCYGQAKQLLKNYGVDK